MVPKSPEKANCGPFVPPISVEPPKESEEVDPETDVPGVLEEAIHESDPILNSASDFDLLTPGNVGENGKIGSIDKPGANTPPSERVHYLLGSEDGSGTESHPLFSEMEELLTNPDGEMEWKETARWLKFEEDVENGGHRWSKPHVGTLSLHSLFELRSYLSSCSIQLDIEAQSLPDIAETVLTDLSQTEDLPTDLKAYVKEAILKKHRHQHQRNQRSRDSLPIIRSIAEIGRRHSSTLGLGGSKANADVNQSGPSPRSGSPNEEPSPKINEHFMKKVPKNAEGNSILVGDLALLERPIACFIRLANAVYIGDLTEVAIPTRFIFILLGPTPKDQAQQKSYREIGRAMATIMSDDVFHDVAYKAKDRQDLMNGLDEFLDAVTVLPPGEWDPSIRIEPPASVPSQDGRKKPVSFGPMEPNAEEVKLERKNAGLVRSGRLFGGLVNDVKRKLPWYKSDFKDGLNGQCLASIFFMYFAVLAPTIIIGGLLGEATGQHVSVIEALIGGCMVGVMYALFSGQPLSILGPTGPVLVFETILYSMSSSLGFEYMPVRFWVGVWIALLLMVSVAFDLSSYVTLITRFTEETFAALIGIIFIVKAANSMIDLAQDYPMFGPKCSCSELNLASGEASARLNLSLSTNLTQPAFNCLTLFDNGTFEETLQLEACSNTSNVFLASLLFFLMTYTLSTSLKRFRTSSFFGSSFRSLISNFAVVIVLGVMTLTDYLVGVDTPKLTVPKSVVPTLEGRSWIVNPFDELNPWWIPLVSLAPAIVGTILIFMDQQITVVIVNRKENRLQKGCGYHLDLFVVSLMILVCSIFGFPWCEASTVPAINHVKSLQKQSSCSAPGEQPKFLGIQEQRVTHLVVYILIGVSVYLAPYLSYIPMPVLFGVFLFMGITALDGLQVTDRFFLFFIPKKYQPDLPYLRRVPLAKINGFTMAQICCLLVLYGVNETPHVKVIFPLCLAVTVIIRKYVLTKFFKEEDLQMLDDAQPSSKRVKQMDKEDGLKEGENGEDQAGINLIVSPSGNLKVPMANGNILNISVTDGPQLEDIIPRNPREGAFNISEEMDKSGIWKSLENKLYPIAREGNSVRRRPQPFGKEMIHILGETEGDGAEDEETTSSSAVSKDEDETDGSSDHGLVMVTKSAEEMV